MAPWSDGHRDAPAVDRRAPRVVGRRRRRTPKPVWRRLLGAGLWVVIAVCGTAYATSLAVPLWYQVHQQRLLIVTSGSIMLALATLLLFGPDVIFGLTAAILLGTFIGTYSSIYISAPILVWLGVKSDSFLKVEDKPAKVTGSDGAVV